MRVRVRWQRKLLREYRKKYKKEKVYDGNTFTDFTYSVSGFVNGEASDVVSGEVTYTGDAATAVNAGDYSIKDGADFHDIPYDNILGDKEQRHRH